jgi:hypothetical protein
MSVGSAQSVANPTIVSETIIIRLDDGDFLHPTFSPDGTRLAYSKVVIEDNIELTEVYVYEFASNTTINLLDATRSRDFSVYKAFAYHLEWTSNNTLVAYVSDGDVDTTLVQFDVSAGRIINALPDEDGEMAWYAKIEDWMQSVGKLPGWEPEIVRNALENGRRLRDGSFLMQPQYHGVPPNVFHLTSKGRLSQLTQLPQSALNSLCGGFEFNGTILFLLAESRVGNSRQAELLHYRNGQIEKLISIATMTEPDLRGLLVDNTKALFFISTGYPYQQSPGALYMYSAAGLHQWQAPGALHDVEIDGRGQNLALVFWQDNRRVIEVRKIGKSAL